MINFKDLFKNEETEEKKNKISYHRFTDKEKAFQMIVMLNAYYKVTEDNFPIQTEEELHNKVDNIVLQRFPEIEEKIVNLSQYMNKLRDDALALSQKCIKEGVVFRVEK